MRVTHHIPVLLPMDSSGSSTGAAGKGGNSKVILLADFNSPHEALEGSPWMACLKSRVLRPSNTDVTCRMGESHSLIDYAVVSESIE